MRIVGTVFADENCRKRFLQFSSAHQLPMGADELMRIEGNFDKKSEPILIVPE